LDELEKILVEYRRKKFLVIEPPGNNGDQLIFRGMEKKLNELGIIYTVLRYEEIQRFSILQKLYFNAAIKISKAMKFAYGSNRNLELCLKKINKKIYERPIKADKVQTDSSSVILIHGGGNINDIWGSGILLLRNAIQHNPDSTIIVAPQTYWFNETPFVELFHNVRQQIYLFCRGRYSYNLLNSMSLPENVHINLSHDTTFYLSKEDFHARASGYDLICFRTDKESALFRKTKPNITNKKGIIDLSRSKKGMVIGDISLLNNFRDFINLVEGSRKVFTDRLHVAILAALLGKDTILYPNSYYKNREVYEFSLSKYHNVFFDNDLRHFEAIINSCAVTEVALC